MVTFLVTLGLSVLLGFGLPFADKKWGVDYRRKRKAQKGTLEEGEVVKGYITGQTGRKKVLVAIIAAAALALLFSILPPVSFFPLFFLFALVFSGAFLLFSKKEDQIVAVAEQVVDIVEGSLDKMDEFAEKDDIEFPENVEAGIGILKEELGLKPKEEQKPAQAEEKTEVELPEEEVDKRSASEEADRTIDEYLSGGSRRNRTS